MNADHIKAIQTAIGTTADGLWGPKSTSACQAHLRSLMPSPHPWPASDRASLEEFYGPAGDESQLVNLAVTDLGVKYEGVPVKTIRCHKKVAPSLLRIIKQISATPFAYVLANYAGCYNYRNTRGGNTLSLHADGAAVDFDPDTNGNNQAWPVSATMPFEVMEIFASEGWLAAGASWGRDAMHFQATR